MNVNPTRRQQPAREIDLLLGGARQVTTEGSDPSVDDGDVTDLIESL